MSIEKHISANGCVALWELSGVYDLSHVRAAFARAGFPDVSPTVRTNAACLAAALSTVYARRGVQVRSLGTDCYAVVEDVPKAVDLRMTHNDLNAARVNADGTLTIRESDEADRIRVAYEVARSQIDHDGLSAALTRVVQESLVGTPVRPRGGVYWVPAQNADRWRALGSALEELPAGNGRASLYAVTTVGDADTVKAIASAFVREADAEVDALREELPEIGKRAATNRAKRLAELSAIADYYAQVLGASLDAVRQRIEVVGAQAGAAALDAI